MDAFLPPCPVTGCVMKVETVTLPCECVSCAMHGSGETCFQCSGPVTSRASFMAYSMQKSQELFRANPGLLMTTMKAMQTGDVSEMATATKAATGIDLDVDELKKTMADVRSTGIADKMTDEDLDKLASDFIKAEFEDDDDKLASLGL